MKAKLRPIIAVPAVLCILVLLLSDTFGTATNFKPWNGYGSFTAESFKAYGPANKQIDFSNIDYGLLQAAVFFETNRMRQQNGKPSLIHSDGLERSAMMHAMDMADRNFFSHDNPYDAKKKRFTDRTGMFGAKGAAENIATTFGIQYKAGTSVSSISAIPPHTYNSFAVALVDGWMHSSGHRANILDESRHGYQYLGCGVYPIPGDSWKKFYAVQNFAYGVSDTESAGTLTEPAGTGSGSGGSSAAAGTASQGSSGAAASGTAASSQGALGNTAPAGSTGSGTAEVYYITQFEYFSGKNGVWQQIDGSGKAAFTYLETKRDGVYIYLYDKSRDKSIALPLGGGPTYTKDSGQKSWQKWLSVRK